MVLSPSQQTESQSTCTVFLGGDVLGGRRGGEKPRDVRVCGEGMDKNQSWLWFSRHQRSDNPLCRVPRLLPSTTHPPLADRWFTATQTLAEAGRDFAMWNFCSIF